MSLSRTKLLTGAAAFGLMAGTAQAAQVIATDLIVQGSACVGLDCVNGEVFGFDTLRLKENNTRIKFQDTSVSASFPTNDWQLTANETSNGGLNKFSIDDIDGGRTPFTIEAGAPSHSLYVDDGGRVGLGTATPVVELHVADGDTPTMRLQQDGSSGFTPQTWDVAGNETNFFVRDATNGSRLPFKIRPSAPTNSIYVDTDGDIGLGTASPGAALHLVRSDTNSRILIEENSGTAGARQLVVLRNKGNPEIRFENENVNQHWDLSAGLNFVIQDVTGGTNPMTLSTGGNLTITGNFIAAGGQLNVPDYVFEDDYELMPLAQVAAFIDQNGHLPRIPSAHEIRSSDRLDMTQMQMALLEKVEELTLYTLAQEDTIATLQARLERLEN